MQVLFWFPPPASLVCSSTFIPTIHYVLPHSISLFLSIAYTHNCNLYVEIDISVYLVKVLSLQTQGLSRFCGNVLHTYQLNQYLKVIWLKAGSHFCLKNAERPISLTITMGFLAFSPHSLGWVDVKLRHTMGKMAENTVHASALRNNMRHWSTQHKGDDFPDVQANGLPNLFSLCF